ncbi:hypothetical protein MMC19_006385 [Ptychographa xylographoides]|nr:hypothetical protein [Ptychographa xylographoides]
MPKADELQQKREAAREVIDVLQEIAVLLNTKLNRTQLSLSVSLIENGVNPEALAVCAFPISSYSRWLILVEQTVIKELRKVSEKARFENAGSDSAD